MVKIPTDKIMNSHPEFYFNSFELLRNEKKQEVNKFWVNNFYHERMMQK